MNSKLIGISKHDREWVSRTIHHSALVVIEDYDPTEKNEVMSGISIKASYHPAGYGLYHQYNQILPTGNANEYLVKWRTSDSCD